MNTFEIAYYQRHYPIAFGAYDYDTRSGFVDVDASTEVEAVAKGSRDHVWWGDCPGTATYAVITGGGQYRRRLGEKWNPA